MKRAIMFTVLLSIILCAACIAPAQPATIATPAPPMPNVQPAIDNALSFLEGQYNADYRLLQESPTIGAQRYYITNDNVLAAHLFALYGIDKPIDLRGYTGNGFIEISFGQAMRWPPYHHVDQVIEQHGEDQVLYEAHDGPGYFSDWSGFSNLACMAIVNEINGGYLDSARRLYAMQMSSFDGHGWPDLAYQRRDGVYETLGLAWCLYAGALLGQPDMRVLDALLAQQDTHGGFHTHYRVDEYQLADPNVETTSIAILALRTVQQPPKRFGFIE